MGAGWCGGSGAVKTRSTGAVMRRMSPVADQAALAIGNINYAQTACMLDTVLTTQLLMKQVRLQFHDAETCAAFQAILLSARLAACNSQLH